MRRHEGDRIDLVGVTADCAIVLDKADRLRVGIHIGERPRKGGIARELQDARLSELVGAEHLVEDAHRHLHGSQHAIDLIGTMGVVLDRKIHIASLVVFHGVGCGLHRREVANGCLRLELHRAAAILDHFRYGITECDGRDAEALAHAAGEACDRFLANAQEIDLLE